MEQVKPRKNFTLQVFATDLDKDAIDKARQGILSGQHRRRRVAGAAEPVLCQGRTRLPGAQRDSGDGDLCPAEPHHGSALYQAGYLELPQPADLPGAGGAEEAHSAVSLQPDSRRHPVPRQRGDHRRLHRPVYAPERQIADLSADAIPSCGRSRSSFRRPLPLRCPTGRSHARRQNRRSASSLWRISWFWSITPRRPCWSTTRATSSTSAAGPANTWNPPPAKPTGISLPWPAKACATNWATPSRKRSDRKRPCRSAGLKVGTNGGQQYVDITVQRLEEPESLRGLVMIVFTDVAAPLETKARAGQARKTPAHNARLEELERKLQQARRRRRPCAKKCRPRRKNSGPPTRNCSPPTRNSSPPTRN